MAVWLLNYAPNKEQLLQMCQTVYDNLNPGQRFLTVCGNPDTKEPGYPLDGLKKYGYLVEVPQPLQEGSIISVTAFTNEEKVQFNTHYFSRATTEWALTTAGFKTVTWYKLLLPPEIEQEDGREFWEFHLETSSAIIIEAQK